LGSSLPGRANWRVVSPQVDLAMAPSGLDLSLDDVISSDGRGKKSAKWSDKWKGKRKDADGPKGDDEPSKESSAMVQKLDMALDELIWTKEPKAESKGSWEKSEKSQKSWEKSSGKSWSDWKNSGGEKEEKEQTWSTKGSKKADWKEKDSWQKSKDSWQTGSDDWKGKNGKSWSTDGNGNTGSSSRSDWKNGSRDESGWKNGSRDEPAWKNSNSGWKSDESSWKQSRDHSGWKSNDAGWHGQGDQGWSNSGAASRKASEAWVEPSHLSEDQRQDRWNSQKGQKGSWSGQWDERKYPAKAGDAGGYSAAARSRSPLGRRMAEDHDTPRGSSIEVNNVPPNLDMRDIRNAFEDNVGPVTMCTLRNGVAKMIFERPESAQKAVRTFDNGQLNGHYISVHITH